MMTFYEYAAWRRRTTLPDAVTMLQRAGIDPAGPHEVEVMRLTKQLKKTAERARNKQGGLEMPRGEKPNLLR